VQTFTFNKRNNGQEGAALRPDGVAVAGIVQTGLGRGSDGGRGRGLRGAQRARLFTIGENVHHVRLLQTDVSQHTAGHARHREEDRDIVARKRRFL